MKKHLHTVKKILHIKLTILVVIIFPLIIFTLFVSRTEVFGIRSFVVLTGSMRPTIPQGSIIFTNKEQSYKIGEVIAFTRNGVTVTHRIVNVKDKRYQTMGDANNAVDTDPVAPASVLGKTVFNLPYLGLFVLFVRTLPGFVLFVILPGVIFIILELFAIKNNMEIELDKKYMKKLADLMQ